MTEQPAARQDRGRGGEVSCPPDGRREDSLVTEGKRGVCQKRQTPNKAAGKGIVVKCPAEPKS